jgi:hypothetical protein
MSITLSDGQTTINLNPDLIWSDEFGWHPVEQKVERTITGALIAQSQRRVGGRPITLESETDNSGWMRRETIEQLRNWAAEPGQNLVLTLHSVPRNVVFRHQDAPALDARPVVHFSEMEGTDFYRATLRLMEI